MKKVLGLDLGTTSIGWALVNQAESDAERSSIIKAGVRVNPLSSDEKDSFEKGKDITTNADRRLKRGMRRNLQRYHLRRDNLIKILKKEGWISDETILAESGNRSTFETYKLRAKAVSEPVSLEQFARILLMINKKRGYKSNRKATGDESGTLIDGMSVAEELYNRGITPGQYCYEILKNGGKFIPDFYKSDLENELVRIWNVQHQYYPEILTEQTKEKIKGKSRTATAKYFKDSFGLETADNKGKNKKLQSFIWRREALNGRLEKEVVAYVIADLCGAISNTSGLLGAISDRSKELFFKHKTVGQYLWDILQSDPNKGITNLTFYRQDYLDEFNALWNEQAKYHKELTYDLKKEICDIVIFYQRRLKSQKGLISHCEFEKNHRVAPKSSPLFQEFKLWQSLNNVFVTDMETGEKRRLSINEMNRLAGELHLKDKLTGSDALKILFGKKNKAFDINMKSLEGNSTLASIASKLVDIVNIINDGDLDIKKTSAEDVLHAINSTFYAKGYSTDILDFNPLLDREEYENQTSVRLWHLTYSFEGDDSKTGDQGLIKKVASICQIPEDYAKIISKVSYPADYGSLSSRAIRKILPYLIEGNQYDMACFYAGYNHSSSLTREEIENKVLVDRLDILPKNSLRNPVVEKILNQMINVVNSVSEKYGKPDEIHIEMARELKKNQKERASMYESQLETTKDNERISDILKRNFHIVNVRKTDILRYKLYEELATRGYKTLYSGQYIPQEKLFSPEIDIEHIIPQSVLFNDSFSNKTLEYRAVNLEKSDMTAIDYVEYKFGEQGLAQYKADVEELVKANKISRTKGKNLLMKKSDLPEGFLERELRDSQYIARKAREILGSFVKTVLPTTGSITAKLREDWQLVDIMKELNIPKYEKVGMTYTITDQNGERTKKIQDWTKRNDHRHHAMDALTIAFTKPSHIQYLNNLNARSDKSSVIYSIFQKETVKAGDKRIFVPPMPLNELRRAFKDELENVLVSIKAKNKVVTRNLNKTKKKDGFNKNTTLTPRGSLHKETVYGRRRIYEKYEVAVGARLTAFEIAMVASQVERNALLSRLEQYNGDPKKAFTGKNSPENNPIFIDSSHSSKIGKKVSCVRMKDVYSVRKDIDPSLKLDKVMDARIRKILRDRLDEFGGNATKAFSNLQDNPIWLNKEKGISIKKVTIAENFDLVALHDKKDFRGNKILDKDGNTIPSDYVNLRNNHHIALYKGPDGNIVEKVVTFYEALDRVSSGFKAVDTNWKKDEGFTFMFSMKINEMFVFPNPATGFDPKEIDLTDNRNYAQISPNLYRVQKLSSSDYWFRHHLETTLDDNLSLKNITWKRITSLNSMNGAIKVRINHIGEIVSVGEYD